MASHIHLWLWESNQFPVDEISPYILCLVESHKRSMQSQHSTWFTTVPTAGWLMNVQDVCDVIGSLESSSWCSIKGSDETHQNWVKDSLRTKVWSYFYLDFKNQGSVFLSLWFLKAGECLHSLWSVLCIHWMSVHPYGYQHRHLISVWSSLNITPGFTPPFPQSHPHLDTFTLIGCLCVHLFYACMSRHSGCAEAIWGLIVNELTLQGLRRALDILDPEDVPSIQYVFIIYWGYSVCFSHESLLSQHDWREVQRSSFWEHLEIVQKHWGTETSSRLKKTFLTSLPRILEICVCVMISVHTYQYLHSAGVILRCQGNLPFNSKWFWRRNTDTLCPQSTSHAECSSSYLKNTFTCKSYWTSIRTAESRHNSTQIG